MAQADVLNVTLELTTADLLPVSAVLQAASLVWVGRCLDISLRLHQPDVCLAQSSSLRSDCTKYR